MMKYIKVFLLLLLLLSSYRSKASPLTSGSAGVAMNVKAPLPVTAVWVPGPGLYNLGSQLTFTVLFDPGITIDPGPTPLLDVIIGSTTRKVPLNNSGAGFMVFSYIVQAGDLDLDGITLGTLLDMNGAIMKDPGGNSLDPQLNNVSATDAVTVNGIQPSALISAAATTVNQPFTATITFSEAVTVFPALALSGCNVSNIQTVNPQVFTMLVSPTAALGSIQVLANSTKNAAGNWNTTSGVFSFSYDNTPPQITTVTVPPNKIYKKGDMLSFTVNYNENIILNTTGGNPYLNLVLASGAKVATLDSRGANYITFSYQVQQGDEDLLGPALGADIVLNGATIQDAAGNNALFTLQNVGSLANVLVDGNPPVVTAVSVPSDGYYKAGNTLNFGVSLSEAVSVDLTAGVPSLDIIIGATTRKAVFQNINGGKLNFSYTIQPGEVDLDGITLVGPLSLNGGTIRDIAGNDLNPVLNNVGSTTHVFVNAVIPTVTLSTTATSPLSQPFTATVTFSEVVTGFTVGDISAGNATLSSFATADNIVYTVLVTPTAAGAVNLIVPASVAVNVGGNGNAASNLLAVTYNFTPPNITNVTVPANKTYRKGEVLSFNVYYNENIVVDTTPGVPFIYLVLASGARNVPLTAIGTNYVTFSYTVQSGDEDLTGPALGTNMILNNGTIRDAAGSDAYNTLQNVASLRNVLVDARPPVVTSVIVPADGYYHGGQSLNFALNFSKAVVVNTTAGTPSIDVTIGSTVRKAYYTSGSGSSQLIFSYQVQNGEMDMDGIALGAMTLNNGTIQDATGNDAVLTLNNVGSTTHVFVNTSIPTVALSTTAASPLNHLFTATVTFSEVVTGFVAGDISVTNATLGPLSTADNITYTVLVTPTAAGAVNLSVPASVAVNVGGNGNAASNLLAVTYDPTPPNITNVTVPANKTYRKGEVLSFNVYYNENIVVDATPGVPFIYLVLASGARNVPLTAIGTNYVTFSYTVQPGDEDLTGPSLGTGMVLNGGTIRDAAGNDASLTLQNVASLRNVLVDAKGPVVTSVAVPGSGYYHTGANLSFTVNFSENAIVNTTAGTPAIDVTIGSTIRKAYYISGSGTSNLVFSYQVQNGEMDMDGIALGTMTLNNGTIQDATGNDAVLTLNNVGNTSSVFVNTSIPTVTLSTAATSPLNHPFTATITFSEAMTGFTAGSITVANASLSNLQTTDRIIYTVLVTPAADGVISLQVPASVAVNVGNNGNTASNTLNMTYDGTAPFISSVTLPSNGYYKMGSQLDFALQVSENVGVTMAMGTKSYLTLSLTTGIEQAYYTGITGGNVLHYSYTVKAGDMDLDGITVASDLLLNGTLIKDAAGNDMLLPLNNMGSTASIFVNTAHPSVVLSTTATGRINAPFTATLRFSEVVSGLIAGAVTVTNGTAGNLQTTDHITYTVTITPSADGAVSVTLPANVALNIGGNGNTASNSIGVTYDGTPPVIPAGLAFVIKQNSPVGSLVGKLTATDAAGTIQNWIIARDNSGGAFALDANGNITVKDVALLNNYAGTTVILQVTVSDGLNTTAPMPVAIHIAFVNKAPTLDAISNVNSCATGDVYTIKLTGASATEPPQTYTYNVSSSADLFDELTVANGDVFRYKLKNGVSSGQATIAITIKDNGGTDNGGVDSLRRTFTILVHSLPVVNINSDKGTAISKGDIVALTATGGNTYRWTVADGIISGDRTRVLQAKPMVKTTYTVIVANADGCSSTGEITIDVKEDFKVDATNILTPNGDGKNDKWVIRNIDSYPDNEVKIFDRAGRMVYQRRNYSNDWQGTLNGNPLAEGTYYYILSIQNGAKTTKGFITIVRDK